MNNFTLKQSFMLVCFLMLNCILLQAQNYPIHLSLEADANNKQLDIVVENFDDVLGFQFGIQFDKPNLVVQELIQSNPDLEGYLQHNVIGNNILVVWTSNNVEPTDISAGSTLFSFKFGSSINDVTFCGSEDEIEFEGAIDVNGEIVQTGIILNSLCEDVNPCVLVCNSIVDISLPQTGELSFVGKEDLFLEGDGCLNNNLWLYLYDNLEDLNNDKPLDDLSFTSQDAGRELIYKIEDLDTGNACWGGLRLHANTTGNIIAPANATSFCGETIEVDGISQSGLPLFYVQQDNAPFNSYGSEDQVEELGKYDNISSMALGSAVYVQDDFSNIDACGNGNLKRTYNLTDADGSIEASANQNITITSKPFDPIFINWPENANIACNGDSSPNATGMPEFEESPCHLLATTYMDVVIDNEDYKKILRTWTVVDWCTGAAISQDQIIKFLCLEGGDITAPSNTSAFCGDNIEVNGLSQNGLPLFFVTQDNAPFNSFGSEDELEELGKYDNYSATATGSTVFVKDDYSNIDNCGQGNLIRTYYLADADGSLNASDSQNIEISSKPFDPIYIAWPEDIDIACNGDSSASATGTPEFEENPCHLLAWNYEDVVIENEDYKKILRSWTIVDWCTGAAISNTQIIKFICLEGEDTLAPIAICLTGLSTTFGTDGTSKIWAQDLDGGSYDNIGIVKFEIKRSTDTEYTEYIILDQSDPQYVAVNIQVSDAAGNIANCHTSIMIIDQTSGGCTLICDALVLIAVDANNSFSLASNQDVFNLEQTSCPNGDLKINLYDSNGQDISNETFTSDDEGYLGSYEIHDQNSGSKCWGAFKIVKNSDALVWPGDTDNNGIVDNFDLLNIGVGFGKEGPSRNNASSNWTGQEASNWDYLFNQGLNYKFADADGSGKISFADVDAIENNWGQEHNFTGETNQSQLVNADETPLFLEPGNYSAGVEVAIPIILGENNFPAEGAYGLAFSIEYDPALIQSGSMKITYNESWLLAGSDENLSVQKNHSEGRLDFAMVRTDHMNESGLGQIATLKLIFNEIDGANEVAALDITKVRLIDALGEEMPTVTIATTINVQENPTSTSTTIKADRVNVFPNPTSGNLNIDSSSEIESIELYNTSGQILETYKTGTNSISLHQYAEQLVLLKIKTTNNVVVKKIHITD